MKIFSHRGNLDGPMPAQENTPAACKAALEKGYGLETDIRFAAGWGFYISHDEASPTEENDARVHAALWRQNPSSTIALNIKEPGQEKDLIEFLATERLLEQVFLFDMELIEPVPGETAGLFRRLSPEVALAARVSDRGEPLERALGISAASVIWLDEFEDLWATSSDIQRMKQAGKTVYAISPELHGFDMWDTVTRWRLFAEWGVDGICTDWPRRLQKELPA